METKIGWFFVSDGSIDLDGLRDCQNQDVIIEKFGPQYLIDLRWPDLEKNELYFAFREWLGGSGCKILVKRSYAVWSYTESGLLLSFHISDEIPKRFLSLFDKDPASFFGEFPKDIVSLPLLPKQTP